jgi:hypothetical protein
LLLLHSFHDNFVHLPYKMDHLFQTCISMSVNCHFSLQDPIWFSKEFSKNLQWFVSHQSKMCHLKEIKQFSRKSMIVELWRCQCGVIASWCWMACLDWIELPVFQGVHQL